MVWMQYIKQQEYILGNFSSIRKCQEKDFSPIDVV